MSRLRRTTQVLGLILANMGFLGVLKLGVLCPFFYCYGCPWAAFACPIGVLQHYSALGQFPFYALGLLGIFGVTLGRFWCGWACPFGTVQDIVTWVTRRKSNVVKVRRVPWTKFVVLAGVLIAAWALVDTVFCRVCPAGSLFAAIPHRFTSPDLPFGTYFYVHLGTLAAAVVAFILIGRFWCRYLCPLGAVFAAFNPVSLLKVKADMGKCEGCRKCLEVCPAAIEKPEEIENCTDCVRCGKCIEKCENGVIQVKASLKR
jgi:ferredoxin-type protein NapH